MDEDEGFFPELDDGKELIKYLKEISAKYRSLFGSPLGNSVLQDLLLTCGFGKKINADDIFNKDERVAYYNVACQILEKCGISQDDMIRSISNSMGLEKK